MLKDYFNPLIMTMLASSIPLAGADDFPALKAQFAALGTLHDAPAVMSAEGYESTEHLKAIYFDALPWKGKPTKVFAWLGMPKSSRAKVPGVVLVHGGGGTAFKEWVTRWNDRGYAAISIAVEGQTDQKGVRGKPGSIPTGWEQHDGYGPWRTGIYADTDQPLADQWMYHAVADTVLANSLLRSLPEVDEKKVGLMGVSWGGVITSTAVGLDPRFAFAIPVYGCGRLYTSDNQYGRSLSHNEIYKQVQDPMQHLEKAAMPILWLSWPKDEHFPLDCLAASSGAAAGPQQMSLIPGMGHGHESAWNRPESYAFADSVVQTGTPWYRQTESGLDGNTFRVSFESARDFDRAVLVSTTDTGYTGKRSWAETPAFLAREGTLWAASADLPAGTTGWFINLISDDLVATSGYQERALHGPDTSGISP